MITKLRTMKLPYIFFLLVLVIASSCGSDDEPEVAENSTVLNYDGENQTAPTLPAGLYEFAVRFPSLIMRNVEGRNITQVSFYLYNIPSDLYINISPDLTPTLPGNILYTQQVTNLESNSWNTVTLDQPYSLDGNPLWIGIEVTQNDQIQTVGCDAGPADPNGDWLYDEENKEWETFSIRTNQNESVNWNVRAIVEQ